MSLAFLSKKTWHVTNFSNQEAVWKAEQAKAEEQRKLEEWKKKREEERQIMELTQLQRESGQGGGEGAVKQQERVEFLYDMPATKKEEYLLGKPIEIEPEERLSLRGERIWRCLARMPLRQGICCGKASTHNRPPVSILVASSESCASGTDVYSATMAS